MSDENRLKQMLEEAKHEFEEMDDWMKSQEPAPGVSYREWIESQKAAETHEEIVLRKLA